MNGTTIILLWVWWILLFFPLRAANRQLMDMGKRLSFLETVILYISLSISLPHYYYLWIKEVVGGNKK
jgi:hypothetical protein